MNKKEMSLLEFRNYCKQNDIVELSIDTYTDAILGSGLSILKMRFDKVIVQTKPDMVFLSNEFGSLEINNVKRVIISDIGVSKEQQITFLCKDALNKGNNVPYTFLAKF